MTIANWFRYPGDDIPIIRGSALAALRGDNPEIGRDAVLKLMQAVDSYIPLPARALDKPFSMPVEDVFSIQVSQTFAKEFYDGVMRESRRHTDAVAVQGRGTVITGRIEQGIVKTGDEIELVGINERPTKSVVTGESKHVKAPHRNFEHNILTAHHCIQATHHCAPKLKNSCCV